MKSLPFILLLIQISFASFAQPAVDNLFLKANRSYDRREYDSSIYYFNEMLRLTTNKDSRAAALNGIGVAYSAKGLPDRSIPYYTEAISLYEELRDTTTSITISNNLAIIYKDKALYENALEISFSTLQKLEKQPPGRPLASSYNTIGTVYTKIQDYAKAYEYYQKSLAVRKAINYEQGIAQSYNNIGELFNEQDKYDSALVNLKRALDIRRKMNDGRGIGRTLTHIGHSLAHSGRLTDAIDSLQEALKFTQKSDDLIGSILALHETGSTYLITKDFRKAEKALSEATALIKQSNNHGHLRRNLELKADLFRATRDQKDLLATLEQLITVKDSIFNEDKMESMMALEIQYETEKKEQQIAILEQKQKIDHAELENSRLQKAILIGAVMFLLAVAALGYRLYFAKQKEKMAGDLHNKEMNHRTKNNLQMLSSFFTIQASVHGDDKKAQELIIDMQGRVKTMALVHNKLYKSMDASELDLNEYITELVTSLLYTYGFSAGNLAIDLKVSEVRIDIDKAIKIGLIVNELITNALKYAFQDQSEPSLKILISRNEHSLNLLIEDNGRHPLQLQVFENGGSFGIKMIKSFVRELHGKIELNNTNGTSFLITIP